jgi:Protein of unknown function (DUF742)
VSPAEDRWLDRDAGPIVRPYALIGGRTRPSGETFEHLTLLRLCRRPTPVADLAADLELPLGVVRILLSDVRERRLITVAHPVPKRLTDPQLLREVADGLRRL